MNNPFDVIDARLSNIETLLLDIKHNPSTTSEPAPERKILHSIQELANHYGTSIVTAQKWKNSGKIPFRQVGRKVMFDTVEIDKAMDSAKRKGGRATV